MKLVFNPFSGTLDWISNIPQVLADPVSPSAETAWVLSDPSYSDGSPLGLLLAITASSITGYTYYFKYRTKQGTTKSVTLT